MKPLRDRSPFVSWSWRPSCPSPGWLGCRLTTPGRRIPPPPQWPSLRPPILVRGSRRSWRACSRPSRSIRIHCWPRSSRPRLIPSSWWRPSSGSTSIRPQGEGPDGRGGEGGLGPERPGAGGLPDVLKRLTENVRWITDLGNAFLAQQTDVMDAVQRLRIQAGGRQTEDHPGTGGHDAGRRGEDDRRDRPGQPGRGLRAGVQPRSDLGAGVLPIPGALLSALAVGRRILGRFGVGVALSWFYPGWNNWYYYGWQGCADWGWGWGWGWHGWGWGCGWGPYSSVMYNNYFCDNYGYHHGGHGGRRRL